MKLKEISLEEITVGKEIQQALFNCSGTLLLSKGQRVLPEFYDSIKCHLENGHKLMVPVESSVIPDRESISMMGHLLIQQQYSKLGLLIPDYYDPESASELISRIDVDKNLGMTLADLCIIDLNNYINAISFESSLNLLKCSIEALYEKKEEEIELSLGTLKCYCKKTIGHLFYSKDNYFPDRIAYSTFLRATQGDSTFIHCLNVAKWAIVIASLVNVQSEEKVIDKVCNKKDVFYYDLEQVALSAFLHDAGKFDPEIHALIEQPGRLIPEQYEIVKEHPARGNKILELYTSVVGTQVPIVALQHHERVDGSGYPKNLRLDMVNPYAALIAVADCFEAMFFRTHYRDSYFSSEEIFDAVLEEVYRQNSVDYNLQESAVSKRDFAFDPFFAPMKSFKRIADHFKNEH
jgi:HD-GYP domain-containing protein (c-di-GMP phosphodiesterase class II)